MRLLSLTVEFFSRFDELVDDKVNLHFWSCIFAGVFSSIFFLVFVYLSRWTFLECRNEYSSYGTRDGKVFPALCVAMALLFLYLSYTAFYAAYHIDTLRLLIWGY